MKKIILLFLSLFSFSCFSESTSKIELINPYSHLTPPGATVSALFVKITNHSERDINLTGVLGDLAQSYELHNMQTIEGKMQMRRVQSILIPKGKSIDLMPGSFHVMMFGLKKSLKEGEITHLTLIFDNGEKRDVAAKAQKID